MTEVKCEKCAKLYDANTIRTTGFAGMGAGATHGATEAAHMGIAAGPIGAMVAIVPGAIVGGVIGFLYADRFATCTHCGSRQWT